MGGERGRRPQLHSDDHVIQLFSGSVPIAMKRWRSILAVYYIELPASYRSKAGPWENGGVAGMAGGMGEWQACQGWAVERSIAIGIKFP